MKVRAVIDNVSKIADSPVKAFAHLVLEGCIVIRGLKIIENEKGELFVAMPSQKYVSNGKTAYKDIAYPVTKQAREIISNKLISQYKAQMQNMNENTVELTAQSSSVQSTEVMHSPEPAPQADEYYQSLMSEMPPEPEM